MACVLSQLKWVNNDLIHTWFQVERKYIVCCWLDRTQWGAQCTVALTWVFSEHCAEAWLECAVDWLDLTSCAVCSVDWLVCAVCSMEWLVLLQCAVDWLDSSSGKESPMEVWRSFPQASPLHTGDTLCILFIITTLTVKLVMITRLNNNWTSSYGQNNCKNNKNIMITTGKTKVTATKSVFSRPLEQ